MKHPCWLAHMFQISNGKRRPGCLGYVGDYTTQLCRDHNKLSAEPQAASSKAEKPEDKVDMEPASDKESNDEWNLNDPADCLEMLEKSFPACKKAGYSPDMFSKICKFYLQHLKTKTPKGSLASWIKQDLDAGILKSSKQRISWLQAYGKMRSSQFVPNH